MSKCPLTGDECWKHECTWYVQLQGTHPQTAQPLNDWMCAIVAGVIIDLGTGKSVRDLTATVDQQRAEMDHIRPVVQRYGGGNKVPALGSSDPALEDMS